MRLRDLGRVETPDGDLVEQAILRQIALLWQTRPLRRERLYVADEVEIALAYLRDMLLPVLPALYARWERLLSRRPGASCGSAAGLAAIATAIPTSPPTRCGWRCGSASQTVLASYLEQVHALGAELSISTELADPTDAVAALADRSGDVNAARRDEPYRRAITGIYARLAGTYERLTGHPAPRPPSVEARALRSARISSAPIWSPSRTRSESPAAGLLATGGALGRLIRAVETCGFHLATLDLRQNSDVHARVVADLLKVAGVEADYLALDEPARVALLRRELASERPLASPFATYARGDRFGARDRARRRRGACAVRPGLDHDLHRLEVRQRVGPARGQHPAQGSRPLSCRATRRRADHGRAVVRDDRRSASAAASCARGCRCPRSRRRRGARLSGSDGRLLRLQQGRRLSHLGVEPAPGDARARAGVRRGAGRDADLPRPRRRGRPRRRLVVRGDPRAAGRHGAGPHPHHRTGRGDRRQVRHARERRGQPRGDRRGDAAGVAREAGGAGSGAARFAAAMDTLSRDAFTRIAAWSTRPTASRPSSAR